MSKGSDSGIASVRVVVGVVGIPTESVLEVLHGQVSVHDRAKGHLSEDFFVVLEQGRAHDHKLVDCGERIEKFHVCVGFGFS